MYFSGLPMPARIVAEGVGIEPCTVTAVPPWDVKPLYRDHASGPLPRAARPSGLAVSRSRALARAINRDRKRDTSRFGAAFRFFPQATQLLGRLGTPPALLPLCRRNVFPSAFEGAVRKRVTHDLACALERFLAFQHATVRDLLLQPSTASPLCAGCGLCCRGRVRGGLRLLVLSGRVNADGMNENRLAARRRSRIVWLQEFPQVSRNRLGFTAEVRLLKNAHRNKLAVAKSTRESLAQRALKHAHIELLLADRLIPRVLRAHTRPVNVLGEKPWPRSAHFVRERINSPDRLWIESAHRISKRSTAPAICAGQSRTPARASRTSGRNRRGSPVRDRVFGGQPSRAGESLDDE